MQFLIPLAGLLGIEIETITERVKTAIILYAVIVLCGAIGFSFILIAGFFALAEVVGPVFSGLIFAAVFVAVALVVLLIMRMSEGKRQRLAEEKRRTTETSAFVTTAAMTALPVLLRSPAVRTFGLPAAALAAFLLMRNGKNKKT